MADLSFDIEDHHWFAVRLLFRVGQECEPESVYEERVTLWRAPSHEEAIELAESEAREYSRAEDQHPNVEYLGLAQAFRTYIPDRPIEPGDRGVLAHACESTRAADYLSTFFDTGNERQGNVGGRDDADETALP